MASALAGRGDEEDRQVGLSDCAVEWKLLKLVPPDYSAIQGGNCAKLCSCRGLYLVVRVLIPYSTSRTVVTGVDCILFHRYPAMPFIISCENYTGKLRAKDSW